jgi:hypothetical protein
MLSSSLAVNNFGGDDALNGSNVSIAPMNENATFPQMAHEHVPKLWKEWRSTGVPMCNTAI